MITENDGWSMMSISNLTTDDAPMITENDDWSMTHISKYEHNDIIRVNRCAISGEKLKNQLNEFKSYHR